MGFSSPVGISFGFLQISFWAEVLSCQIEKPQKKRGAPLYRSTRLHAEMAWRGEMQSCRTTRKGYPPSASLSDREEEGEGGRGAEGVGGGRTAQRTGVWVWPPSP